MRADLQGLEITQGELKQLTGLNIDNIFKPSLIKKPKKGLIFFISKLPGLRLLIFAIASFIIAYLISLPILYYFNPYYFDCLISLKGKCPDGTPFYGKLTETPVFFGVMAAVMILPVFWELRRFWKYYSFSKSAGVLIDEVDKYNAVIKAVDINDQLKAVGNQGASISDRNKVIELLVLTRRDLVRALKTQRILSENKDFIVNNPEIFANNLTILEAVRVSEKGDESGRLLNEALQMAIDVQKEMKKLQNQR